MPPAASFPAPPSRSRTTPPARTFDTVTNTAGAFSVPALDPGTYTVTVSLDGFKTAVINDVRLLAATPGSIRATLEVGSADRDHRGQGRHRAGADAVGDGVVDAQRPSRSPTCRSSRATRCTRCRSCPASTRPAGPRGSTINGLPQNTINVTYRRRQREQQPPVDRRLLLDGHAAARRGRGGDGHRRDAAADQAALGRGADRVRRRARAPTSSTAASTTTSATPR